MTVREPDRHPPSVAAWMPLKRFDVGGTTLCCEVCGPGGLRLTLEFGFSAIIANGVDEVSDLIAAFQLQDEARVACHLYGFVLSEVGDEDGRRVAFRDKAVEVRIPRSDYDRIAGCVSDPIADPCVQAAFTRVYRHHAAMARAAAWKPGPRWAGA